MEKIIFATVAGPQTLAAEVLLFADSLRTYGGEFAQAPFYVFKPDSPDPVPDEVLKKLIELDIRLITFDMQGNEFPFAWVPYSAAAAEAHLAGKTEILVYIQNDSLVLNPPDAFTLPKGVKLAYRPVHHTLVGSIYDQPLDDFWSLVYQHCHVPEERVFPMETCVRDHTIRPYFNAGLLVVRPEMGLMAAWKDRFDHLYPHPDFQPFYKKDERYAVFIHQAVLAGVVLNMYTKDEIQELPEEINYPLHLHHAEVPPAYQPKALNDLTTLRHEGIDHLKEALNGIPVKEPLKGWLEEKLSQF